MIFLCVKDTMIDQIFITHITQSKTDNEKSIFFFMDTANIMNSNILKMWTVQCPHGKIYVNEYFVHHL